MSHPDYCPSCAKRKPCECVPPPQRADFKKVSEVYAEMRKPKGPVPMRSDWHFYR